MATFEGNNGNNSIIGTASNDLIEGKGGSDELRGAQGNDTIYGNDAANSNPNSDGNDVIYGGAGNDTLQGNRGNDVLNGGADNDIIYGGQGDDFIYGNVSSNSNAFLDGADILYGDAGNDNIQGNEGNDTLYGGTENDILRGGKGADTLYGEEGDDVLYADIGDSTLNDYLDGGSGNDTLYGGNSNDILVGGSGNDIIVDGLGSDTLSGGTGGSALDLGQDQFVITPQAGALDTITDFDLSRDVINLSAFGASGNFNNFTIDDESGGVSIHLGGGQILRLQGQFVPDDFRAAHFMQDGSVISGTTGTDSISGTNNGDVIYALEGNDVVFSGNGDDFINGGTGDDELDGGLGNDHIRGGQNNDTIRGKEGDDYLQGDKGADTIAGGMGDDTLEGGEDNDTLFGGVGGDIIWGEEGGDMLYGNSDQNQNPEQDGDDILYGGTGNDTLQGNEGNDTLYGGQDNDILRGGKGDDILYGDLGDDILYGDRGSDFLTGGEGNDIFILEAFPDQPGTTTITDFKVNGGIDKIDISAYGIQNIYDLDISQDSEDTVIDFSNGNILVIKNTNSSSLTASDFINKNYQKILTIYNIGEMLDNIGPSALGNETSVKSVQAVDKLKSFIVEGFDVRGASTGGLDSTASVIDISRFNVVGLNISDNAAGNAIVDLGDGQVLEILGVSSDQLNEAHFITSNEDQGEVTQGFLSDWGSQQDGIQTRVVNNEDFISHDNGNVTYVSKGNTVIYSNEDIGQKQIDVSIFTAEANNQVQIFEGFNPHNSFHKIDMSAYSFSSFSQMGVESVGSDTVLNVGDGKSVVLKNVSKESLSEDNFSGFTEDSYTETSASLHFLARGEGNFIIEDFEGSDSYEKIVLSSFDDINDISDLSFEQNGADATIHISDEQSVTVKNTDVSILQDNKYYLFSGDLEASSGVETNALLRSGLELSGGVGKDVLLGGSNDDYIKQIVDGADALNSAFQVAGYAGSKLVTKMKFLSTIRDNWVEAMENRPDNGTEFLKVLTASAVGSFSGALTGASYAIVGSKIVKFASKINPKLGVAAGPGVLGIAIEISNTSNKAAFEETLSFLDSLDDTLSIGYDNIKDKVTTIFSDDEIEVTSPAPSDINGRTRVTVNKVITEEDGDIQKQIAELRAFLENNPKPWLNNLPEDGQAEVEVVVVDGTSTPQGFTLAYENQQLYSVEFGITPPVPVEKPPLTAKQEFAAKLPDYGYGEFEGKFYQKLAGGILIEVQDFDAENTSYYYADSTADTSDLEALAYIAQSKNEGEYAYYKGTLYKKNSSGQMEKAPPLDNDEDYIAPIDIEYYVEDPDGNNPVVASKVAQTIASIDDFVRKAFQDDIDDIGKIFENPFDVDIGDSLDLADIRSFFKQELFESVALNSIIADIIRGDNVVESVENLTKQIALSNAKEVGFKLFDQVTNDVRVELQEQLIDSLEIDKVDDFVESFFDGHANNFASNFSVQLATSLATQALSGKFDTQSILTNAAFIATELAVKAVLSAIGVPEQLSIVVMAVIEKPLMEIFDFVGDVGEAIWDFIGDPFNTLEDLWEKWTDDKWSYYEGSDGNDVMHHDSEWANTNLKDGNDVFFGWEGWNVVLGGNGDDIIYGGNGTYNTKGSWLRIDELYGEAGDDYINGVGADDDILGGAGNDHLIGGAGDDYLVGGDYNSSYAFLGQNDKGTYTSNTGVDGDDILEGGEGADVIIGGDGLDIASYKNSGSAVSINLNDKDANQVVLGSGGDATGDKLYEIEGVIGSAFNDNIVGDNINNHIEGGAGADQLEGLLGDDFIHGNQGEDFIEGGAGNDIIRGGKDNDVIYGNNLANLSADLDGDDTIYGDFGDDNLQGNKGNDTLYGGAGNDIIRGGDGNDVIYGNDLENTNLEEDGDDVIYGDLGNDILQGNKGNDTLYGGIGGDIIRGGRGDDKLEGNEGDDILYGDIGNDQLEGGTGSDTFIIGFDPGSVDEIVDFNIDEDLIDLSSYDHMLANFFDLGAYISEVGGDSIINFGNGHLVAVRSITPDQLLPNHFIGNLSKELNNNAPVVANMIVDQEVVALNELNFTIPDDIFIDADGDMLSFVATLADDSALPSWLEFDTDTLTFSGVAPSDDASSLEIKVIASDGSLTGSQTFNLNILPAYNIIDGTSRNEKLVGTSLDDIIEGKGGKDRLDGKDGDDILNGGSGNDKLKGGNGDDLIIGGDGKDKLYGNKGNDTIKGGAGKDTIWGNEGSDVFVFENISDSTNSSRDVIRDFKQGADILDFEELAQYGIIDFDDVTVTLKKNKTLISANDNNFQVELSGKFNLDEDDFSWQ